MAAHVARFERRRQLIEKLSEPAVILKLRVIARRAYGFHSHGALISMLFLCCGGIELAPPLPTRV